MNSKYLSHCQGFFGKGSLSRSYPCFEKTKRGLPQVVRHRQWARRQGWLRQAEELHRRAIDGDSNDENWENVGKLDSEDIMEVDQTQRGITATFRSTITVSK